ncbi:hypothetical protein CsSME_00043520 [Camellia sinensis var. sinensis]
MQLQKVFSKKAYIDWNATYDYYEKMNVKEAYYLSTEYLQSRALLNAMQGRALLNAIGNLEFSKAYAEALRKLVLNLEYIARQICYIYTLEMCQVRGRIWLKQQNTLCSASLQDIYCMI